VRAAQNIRGAQCCCQDGLTVSAAESALANHLTPDKIIDVSIPVVQEILAQPTLAAAFAESKETQKLKEQKYRAMPITHEAWATADSCLACDLEVNHHVTADRRHLLITLGATTETLVEEAKHHGTHLRLAETKGMMAFHPDLISYYATNLGGLNEATVAAGGAVRWAPRDSAAAADWAQRPAVTEEERPPWMDPNSPVRKVFTSAVAQQLVMRRMQRLGRLDPYVQVSCADAPHSLKHMKKRVCRPKRKRVTAEKCHELLLGHGGYRPHARDVFPSVAGRSVMKMLADACIKDPLFILYPDGMLQSNVFTEKDNNLPTYSMLIDVCRVLEAWGNGVGREEEFIGTMTDFFPLHVDTELAYLRQDWGRFGILWIGSLVGYAPESELKKDKQRPDRVSEAERLLENNAHGSVANTPTIYKFPATLVYQPLEEIKDYFGEDIGLYFCWLDKYTRALFLMSFYGTFVFVRQVTQHEGPDDNPLTLIYSIYCGVWSILFLQAWNRRETELRFLWGLDRLRNDDDETRREFINGPNAMLEVNPDTGRQYYVVHHQTKQHIRGLTSAVCVIVVMFITVASSTAAILVRYAGEMEQTEIIGIGVGSPTDSQQLPEEASGNETDDGSGGGLSLGDGAFSELHHYFYQKKYELLSAFLGLFLIVIFGAIFEGVFIKLTNYENHRTQSGYDNALIAKNFMFQFLNNYWALIYIAYLREVPDPISKSAHPCENGSCLSELQFQVAVVFAFKTIGKQIGFTLRPFVVKAVKAVYANRLVAKSSQLVSDTTEFAGSIVKGVPGGGKVLALQQDLSNTVSEQYDNVLDAAFGQDLSDVEEKKGKLGLNDYEVQDSLLTYNSTFNDFNDRTVQFGYIVLFAPAFPLAPLLAFINNLVEIRAAGYKLCNGYRRPVVKQRMGIGTWMVVLNTLGFLAVIMNSTMINFVGRQNARNFGVPDVPGFWEDASTAEYNPNLDGGHGVRVENNSGMLGRLNVAPLWLRFFIVEHLSMFVRILVFAFTPDTPLWIKTARETLEYRIEGVYQTNETIDQEKRHREAYEAKLSQHMEEIGRALAEVLSASNLSVLFKEVDSSDTGSLSMEMLGVFLRRGLGVVLTPLEVRLPAYLSTCPPACLLLALAQAWT
jgi:hypothetical protein